MLYRMTGGLTGGMKYQKPTKKLSKFQQWLMSRGKDTTQHGMESDEFGDSTPGFAQFYHDQTGETLTGEEKHIAQDYLGGESNVF